MIDPSVLIYAGYIGGTSFDVGNDVAVDDLGNAYVTGETAGTAAFPAAAGPDVTFNGTTDAFGKVVFKLQLDRNLSEEED